MSVFKGKNISVSIFGQSHSEAIGVVIDGLPSGISVNEERIRSFLKRRAASSSIFSTQRKEDDEPVFVSGVINGKTTGASVCAVIYNKDQRSRDYSSLFFTPRPGHADYTARIKYGGAEDTRGGGAFSGRMTAPFCIVGAIAKDFLAEKGITIGSHVLSIADISEEKFDPVNIAAEELNRISSKPFGTVSDEIGQLMLERISSARSDGDSLGGVIECAAVGVPVGLGGELFDGIESAAAKLVFSVPAVKGFEIGAGFDSSKLRGSENNDPFYYNENGAVKTQTNNHGGILGGMTSGMPIIIRAALKPTPSISKTQKTVDLEKKVNTEIEIKGRHDACIVPRALPVIESCLAIAIFDEMVK